MPFRNGWVPAAGCGLPVFAASAALAWCLCCVAAAGQAAGGADDGVRRATIFTFDPASPRRGAGTKDGAPVLEMTENPPYAVGTAILPADLKVNPYTNFEIEATIAGTGGAMFGVRLVPVTRKKEKLHPMHAGMWGKAAPETFVTLTGRFRMAEDPDVAGEVPDVASFEVRCHRTNGKGTVWVKSLVLKCRQEPLVDAAVLAGEAKKRLAADGYAVEEKSGRIVGKKTDERVYYTVPVRPMPRSEFEAACRIGATYVRNAFVPPLFVVGPYMYGTPAAMEKRVADRGLKDLGEYFDRVAADVAAHGGNTIYYANLTMTPDVFKLATARAQAHGVSVFGQLTAELYLRVERDRKHYDTVTVPNATKILPQYRDLPGVLGWMGKEEAPESAIPWVQEYRALCRKLDPTHPLFTLHNHIAPARADNDHLPEWYGFDRYRFRCIGDQGYVISTPREMVSLLRKEMSEHYVEADRKGRPLIYVGQSYGTRERLTAKDLAAQGLKTLEGRSGFREVEPDVWLGWPRYLPPKHGMYLQSWLAVAEGARGLLWYQYDSWTRGAAETFGLVDEKGNEQPIWRELGACVKEMAPLFPLFLSWHKEAVADAETDTPWAFVRSFIRGFDRERFLVVVNTRIAEWDKTSPPRPANDTELHFDEKGLAGMREAGPLTIKLTVSREGPLWDVTTGTRLTPETDGSYRLTIGPGRGAVLMQGPQSALPVLKKAAKP